MERYCYCGHDAGSHEYDGCLGCQDAIFFDGEASGEWPDPQHEYTETE